MYRIFTDKPETFECYISLEGASINKSRARLVIESKDLSLLFEGTIDGNGKCKIPIKKLKGILDESVVGTVKLEVIAEDTYFVPWESDFIVETQKKVSVTEVKQNYISLDKPKIKVTQTNQHNDHIINLVKILVKEGFNLKNLKQKSERLNKIIWEYQKRYVISEEEKPKIISGILNRLQ